MPPDPFSTGAEAVRARAGDPARGLLFEGRTWTWSEVVAEMTTWGAWLDSLTGAGRPHVGVLLDNLPEYLFALGGTLLTGAVLIGLNSTRRGGELATDVTHTDCSIVLTDADNRPLLTGLDLGGARIVDIGDLPARGADLPAARRTPSPEDLALLLFTAGSTGMPKAVRVTQGRVARSAMGIGFSPDDVLYCAMPLFHGNALFSSVFPALGSGATIALRRRFSASACMPEIRSTSSTFFATIGRALSFIVSTPPDPADRDHRLRVVLAPESSVADMAAFEDGSGAGCSRATDRARTPSSSSPRPGLPPDALGVPVDGLDVAVVNAETGRECEPARFDAAGHMLNAAEAIGEIVGRNAPRAVRGLLQQPRSHGRALAKRVVLVGGPGLSGRERHLLLRRPARWTGCGSTGRTSLRPRSSGSSAGTHRPPASRSSPSPTNEPSTTR